MKQDLILNTAFADPTTCLRFLVSIGALENLKTCDISDCSGCKLTKFFSLAFNRSISVYFSPFYFINYEGYLHE
jgi:hypothetical protein